MTKDPLVVFTPSGKRGHFSHGTSILKAAQQLGVDIDSVCGGRGICSRCQITPSFGKFPKHGVNVAENAVSKWNAVEDRYQQKRGLKQGRRLGCQAKIMGDLVVDVPPESQVHKQIVRKAASKTPVIMDPATKLYFVTVAEPDMHEPTGDFERLANSLKYQWGITPVTCDLNILKQVQTTLRKGKWDITVAIHCDKKSSQSRVLALWPGLNEEGIYGLAIDLGSTTIAAHLIDLQSGKVITSSGIMNPQIRFGEDLMSRVSYAMMNPNGVYEMTGTVRDALNMLVDELAMKASVAAENIVEAVFVCNPVMHHLLLGIDPLELGQAPFALAKSRSLNLSANELDLSKMATSGRCYILPCIAGHVGADAAAVVLAEKPEESKELTLLVDVGTNAEIILGNQSRVLACSSPTGPAFEGAQISSGQRAAPGAIEHIEIDPITKIPRFKIIGCELWSDEPGFQKASSHLSISGICGSGIIEAVAELRLAGLMDESGLLGSPEATGSTQMVEDGRTFSYVVHESSLKKDLTIKVTQADVRAIQLAKSALYAGAKLLMDEMGVENVDRVVFAGAFGAHISGKHALILGMIPYVPVEKIFSAGNAAGTGARIALCNINARVAIEKTVEKILKIETAIEPKFQEYFVAANAIPPKVDAFSILNHSFELPQVNFNINSKKRLERVGRKRRRRN